MNFMHFAVITALFVSPLPIVACDDGAPTTDPTDTTTTPDTTKRTATLSLGITPSDLEVLVTVKDFDGESMTDQDGNILEQIPVTGMAKFVVHHPGFSRMVVETEYEVVAEGTIEYPGKYDNILTNGARVDVELVPSQTDHCAEIRASELCRTWEAFSYNGQPRSGEVNVTCENSTNPSFPGTCEVRQVNNAFIILDTRFYGKHVPTVDNPLQVEEESYTKMLWVEELGTPECTLHIYLKKPNGNESVLLSR